MSKFLEYIAAITGILGFVFLFFPPEFFSQNPTVFIFVACILVISLSVWLILVQRKYKALDEKYKILEKNFSDNLKELDGLKKTVLPRAVHLKGACASTNVMFELISDLTPSEFNNKAVQKLFQAFALSNERRIRELTTGYEVQLSTVKDQLVSFIRNGENISLKDKINEARNLHNLVKQVERDYLRQNGIEDYVYR